MAAPIVAGLHGGVDGEDAGSRAPSEAGVRDGDHPQPADYLPRAAYFFVAGGRKDRLPVDRGRFVAEHRGDRDNRRKYHPFNIQIGSQYSTNIQWTLTVATYYLLDQPETLARLVQELQTADATNRTWNELEKLPYLSAVIAEALRLSYGVSPRSPRIAPNERLVYRGRFQGREIVYDIPPGTPVGMSNAINHHNEEVFPASHTFRVERWLEADEAQRRRMETSLTSFSRGSRSCVGIKYVSALL